MRKKCLYNASSDESAMDISSLIDVCFLLLIFFIVTSTIQPREKDLPMTLPQSHGLPEDEIVKVLLSVKRDGAIVMNLGDDDELLDADVFVHEIPETKERIQMLSDLARANGTELFVEITTHDDVKHQRFIDVLNCLKGEWITKLSITNREMKSL